MKKFGKILFCLTAIFLLSTGNALADKSAVTIIAPESAAKGTEVTIKLNVTHHGNNMLHHTQWVHIKVNGERDCKVGFFGDKHTRIGKFHKRNKIYGK